MKDAMAEWKEYVDAVFPGLDGSSLQYLEVKRAFFSGMLMSFVKMSNLSDLGDEDRSVTQVEDFYQQLKHELELLKGIR